MRPPFSTFRRTLTHWCRLLHNDLPSTNKTYKEKPNYEAQHIGWWYEAETVHTTVTPRDLAYLLAYLEIFGSRLPLKGLAVREGWVWPDKAVIHSLHANKMITVEDSAFVLDEAGREMISAYLSQEGTTFRRVTGTEQKG